MYLTKTTSLTFDILRLIAALTVVYFHCFELWFPKNHSFYPFFSELAHFAVIIFFVLSGYLIGYTTKNNNRGLRKYFVARFSRLYSVLIPVLFITYGIEQLIGIIGYDTSNMVMSRGWSLPRYILSGLFMNEVWFFSAAPPINAPLWSLSFEFWFYIIFGFWFFSKKNEWKLKILLVLSMLIAGPKIISMLPIWLCGMLAFKIKKLNFKSSLIPFILLILALLYLVLFYMPALPSVMGKEPLFFAGQFLKDWVLGALLGVLFWLLPLTNTFQKSTQSIMKFRKIADLTYTIYLIHLPLLYLFKVLINYEQTNVYQYFIVSTLVIIISSGVGFLLESKRQFWNWLFDNISSKIRQIKIIKM
jgi:peptidoglycan/LPS O-acetylase OafA/YrhL